ncbi:carbamoyl-phosphate synthase [Bacillus paranthracis]|uniref:phage tail protein n=1 Tax=Bacillus paranthracis TaxID=2026186 RepID=UPI003D65DC8F
MADGQVRINVGLNTAQVTRGVQQVNQQLGHIGSNMGRVSRQMSNTMGSSFAQLNSNISRGYAQISQESRNMMNEMNNAYKAQKQGMGAVYDAQVKAQYGYFQLAQSQGQYTGSMNDLLGRINEIGKAEKKANDQAINSNKLKMMSIYQTIGYLNNASSTASRFQNNLTQMNNPLYNTSRLALTAVDSLDRLARSGSPQQLALEFLGANASVKQYNDFIRDLNTQMMAMPVIFGLATAGAMKFYGALHGKVMEENTQYAEAFNNMLEKLTKAFEPMRQAFAAVMIPLYNFIAKIAELVIVFNEAHPTLAKFIQGMMMLVPALMVILTPLALGIGYFAGLRAILFALRPIMMPIITGFAMMSAPAWILAGAITGLVMVFTHLWKTNEGFKNSIMSAIGVVAQFGQTMLALGKYLFWTAVDGDHLNDWITHLPEPFQATAEKVGLAISQIREKIVSCFAPIMQFGQHILHLGQYLLSVITTGNLVNQWLATLPVGFQNVATLLGTAILAIKTKINEMVEAFRLALGGDTSALGQIFMTIVPTLVGLLLGGLPALLITAMRFLPTIVEGINSTSSQLSTTITNLITGMVNLITTYLPQFLNQGIQILTKVIEGLVQILPTVVTTLVNCATTMINSFITVIGTLLPVILDAGIKILMAVIDGIVKSLPQIINASLTVINTLVQALIRLLPQIIDAGIKILMALIDGIMKILPNLIQTAIKLILKIAETIMQNLPKILDAGIKILMALIDGIIKILPQLIQAGITIMTKLLDSIIKHLPQIISAGMKILQELINGIIRVLPQLISMGMRLIMEIARAIISNLPQILSAGVQILKMLIQGIVSMIGSLLSTITSNVIGGIKNCFSNAGSMLLSAGKDIINGLIKGATSMAKSAVSTVKGIASDIKNAVTGFFNIHSPSREMAKDGRFIIQGIMVGMEDMSNRAVKSAISVASQIRDGFASLSDDIPMGDIDGSASKFILPSATEFASGAVQSSAMIESSKAIRQAQAIQRRQAQEEKASKQAPMYMILDNKVVGQTIEPEVAKTQERRNARYSQFAPAIAPTY